MKRIEAFKHAVLAHYLATGEGATVSELADRLGWPDNLASTYGAVVQAGALMAYVDVYQDGTKRKWRYRPSLEWVRELARKAVPAL